MASEKKWKMRCLWWEIHSSHPPAEEKTIGGPMLFDPPVHCHDCRLRKNAYDLRIKLELFDMSLYEAYYRNLLRIAKQRTGRPKGENGRP